MSAMEAVSVACTVPGLIHELRAMCNEYMARTHKLAAFESCDATYREPRDKLVHVVLVWKPRRIRGAHLQHNALCHHVGVISRMRMFGA